MLKMLTPSSPPAVLLHLGTGCLVLALGLGLVMLSTMGVSFSPAFRRLTKLDLVFSFLGISVGLLILLSLTLFLITCNTLRPRPQVSYQMTFYLCGAASALMLWAGVLSFLNHKGMWSSGLPCAKRRLSYRRWALQQERRASKGSESRVTLPAP
ncbi:outer dense fiber protein 4-like [Dasypus novemcinctus]|uniref:outer dense fiber protein 4-like n=1 Tax=Dasypus novemcinctus TaxID=9361 RepID=UPI0039C950D9